MTSIVPAQLPVYKLITLLHREAKGSEDALRDETATYLQKRQTTHIE